MKDNIKKVVLLIGLIGILFLYDYWDRTHCEGVSIYYKCKNYLD